MTTLLDTLTPERARIFRIVHRENLPWILAHGLHCGTSSIRCPTWVSIGNPELTAKRGRRAVPVPPFGVLNDYVPFYFTPFSVMLNNIRTGWGGITKRDDGDILVLVSSLHRIHELGLPWLFTDRPAVVRLAQFYSRLNELDRVDWEVLRRRNFKRDPEDPEKFERYQAEALVHRQVPVQALLGAVCATDAARRAAERTIATGVSDLRVVARPQWFFR